MNASWWKSILKVVGLYHGRNQREPVLTIGATNIPESLDPALLRPGRFDRKIIVAAPSDGGRREVIDFYLAKVKHDDMPIEKLVADTMGYTPVAIKHIINEAVVIAHFSGRDRITYRDVSEARETHEHGIRYPRALSLLEKRRLAYHEAGHAVASAKLMPRWRASYVTITKRLESGGEAFAARKPVEEIVTESADEVFATIQVCLASRAAEELFLHTRLNGVGGDLHTATQLALNYIVHWGMGDTFFSALATMAPQDVYTDPELRKDVEALLRKAYTDVKALIERHRAAVIAVAEALLVRDELHSDEIAELIRQSEGPRLAEIAATALGDGAAAPLEAVDAIANGFAAAPTGAPVEANGHAAVPADADLRPQGPVGAKGEGYDAPHREAQQRPEPPVAEQHNFFSAGI